MNTPLLRQPLARLDDYAIQLLLDNAAVVKLLPCLTRPKAELGSLQAGQSNCKACENKKMTIRAKAISMAKDCVIGANAEATKQLKDILLVDKLEIVKILPNGMHQRYEK